jgi:hypothetical protein
LHCHRSLVLFPLSFASFRIRHIRKQLQLFSCRRSESRFDPWLTRLCSSFPPFTRSLSRSSLAFPNVTEIAFYSSPSASKFTLNIALHFGPESPHVRTVRLFTLLVCLAFQATSSSKNNNKKSEKKGHVLDVVRRHFLPSIHHFHPSLAVVRCSTLAKPFLSWIPSESSHQRSIGSRSTSLHLGPIFPFQLDTSFAPFKSSNRNTISPSSFRFASSSGSTSTRSTTVLHMKTET